MLHAEKTEETGQMRHHVLLFKVWRVIRRYHLHALSGTALPNQGPPRFVRRGCRRKCYEDIRLDWKEPSRPWSPKKDQMDGVGTAKCQIKGRSRYTLLRTKTEQRPEALRGAECDGIEPQFIQGGHQVLACQVCSVAEMRQRCCYVENSGNKESCCVPEHCTVCILLSRNKNIHNKRSPYIVGRDKTSAFSAQRPALWQTVPPRR